LAAAAAQAPVLKPERSFVDFLPGKIQKRGTLHFSN